jgi:hypothetical protein
MLDVYTGEELDRLRVSPLEGLGLPFTSDILCVSFSPDGRFIAAGTKLVDEGVVHGGHIGGEVCMWDLEQGANARTCTSGLPTRVDLSRCIAEFQDNYLQLERALVESGLSRNSA